MEAVIKLCNVCCHSTPAHQLSLESFTSYLSSFMYLRYFPYALKFKIRLLKDKHSLLLLKVKPVRNALNLHSFRKEESSGCN